MLKRLFFSSAIILMLALAYHLGAKNVQAQSGGTFAGIGSSFSSTHGYRDIAVTTNGDVYYRSDAGDSQWHYDGNILGGGPISVQPETWGGVKSKYRK